MRGGRVSRCSIVSASLSLVLTNVESNFEVAMLRLCTGSGHIQDQVPRRHHVEVAEAGFAARPVRHPSTWDQEPTPRERGCAIGKTRLVGWHIALNSYEAITPYSNGPDQTRRSIAHKEPVEE
jgi:hypothetical protein